MMVCLCVIVVMLALSSYRVNCLVRCNAKAWDSVLVLSFIIVVRRLWVVASIRLVYRMSLWASGRDVRLTFVSRGVIA